MNTLNIIPMLTVWLAPAKTTPPSAPMAAARPSHAEPVTAATAAAAKAAASILPSRPMSMTPERSANSPPKAASTSGAGVINLSLGGDSDELAIDQAIYTAIRHGSLVVAAAAVLVRVHLEHVVGALRIGDELGHALNQARAGVPDAPGGADALLDITQAAPDFSGTSSSARPLLLVARCIWSSKASGVARKRLRRAAAGSR